MIRLLVEKELRDSVHSARWAAVFGVSAVLILLSFVLGARQHVAAAARHEAARVENLRQAEGLTDWAALRNHRIFLPPQPLDVAMVQWLRSADRPFLVVATKADKPNRATLNAALASLAWPLPSRLRLTLTWVSRVLRVIVAVRIKANR